MTIQEFVNKITDSALAYPNGTFTTPGKVYSCVNPFSYHLVRQHRQLYSKLDGLFVDGMTMCWGIRLLWGNKIPRLSFDMSGMAVDLFKRLNSDNNLESIYFIGAKQEELEGTISQLRLSYPKMKIVGYRNGYFKHLDERTDAIRAVVDVNPTFCIVGMGSPLQEKFVLDLKLAGYEGIAFTCGGFLHQTSNRLKYYPDWVNKYNLRAFYRLCHEKGLWCRLYNVLIQFPLLFTWDTLITKLDYLYSRVR